VSQGLYGADPVVALGNDLVGLERINGMASTARLIVYPLGATALPLCGSRTGG
jgi:hypothetical protein